MKSPTRAGFGRAFEQTPEGVGGNAGKPSHPAPAWVRVSPFLLSFGLFGAAGAWTVQLIANYAIAAHGCFPQMVPLTRPVWGQAASSVFLLAILFHFSAVVLLGHC